jgi:hypothetical protein
MSKATPSLNLVMTSQAKIDANRRNARRSTGPRSAAGKARACRNALRHGLSVRASYDQAAAAQIEEFAVELCPASTIPEERDLALRAAEAEVDMSRLRQAKVNLVNEVAAHVQEQQTFVEATEQECVTVAFLRNSKTLAAFNRYENRLFARRNRALRKLAKSRAAQERLRAAEERSWTAEQVGPPLPKQHRRADVFKEGVLPLHLCDILKPVKPGNTGILKASLRHPIATVQIIAKVESDTGCIGLVFETNGKVVIQKVTIVRRSTQVAGGTWLIECPETKKMVRSLYLAPGQQRFRSHHTLSLTYRTKSMNALERCLHRCEKLMTQIGATDFLDSPPRPKYMRRRTYQQICERMNEEASIMARSFVRNQLL